MTRATACTKCGLNGKPAPAVEYSDCDKASVEPRLPRGEVSKSGAGGGRRGDIKGAGMEDIGGCGLESETDKGGRSRSPSTSPRSISSILCSFSFSSLSFSSLSRASCCSRAARLALRGSTLPGGWARCGGLLASIDWRLDELALTVSSKKKETVIRKVSWTLKVKIRD